MATNSKIVDLGPAIPAPVLRRIAEAADGLRGKENWIAFSTKEEELADTGQKKKHFVSHAMTRAEAEKEAEKPNRVAIGPFITRRKAVKRDWEVEGVDVACKKTSDPASVKSKKIKRHQADAIFWTESAIDKFLIPYYVQMHGWEYGEEIAEAFNHPETYALTHLPGSEYAAKLVTDPTKGGEPVIVEIRLGDAERERKRAGTTAPGAATPEGVDGGS